MTLGLAVDCPTFAILPQEYTKNDLRRSEIQNFLGGMPLAGVLRMCALINWILEPPFSKF